LSIEKQNQAINQHDLALFTHCEWSFMDTGESNIVYPDHTGFLCIIRKAANNQSVCRGVGNISIGRSHHPAP